MRVGNKKDRDPCDVTTTGSVDTLKEIGISRSAYSICSECHFPSSSFFFFSFFSFFSLFFSFSFFSFLSDLGAWAARATACKEDSTACDNTYGSSSAYLWFISGGGNRRLMTAKSAGVVLVVSSFRRCCDASLHPFQRHASAQGHEAKISGTTALLGHDKHLIGEQVCFLREAEGGTCGPKGARLS